MSDSPDDPNRGWEDDSTPPEQDSQQSAGMWLLGCLGKTVLVFVVVVLLVFGACLVSL